MAAEFPFTWADYAVGHPAGFQSRPSPVTWGDGRAVARGVRHDDQPCSFACSTWSSSGSVAGWSCSAAQRRPRTSSCWCCGTRSPCCAPPCAAPKLIACRLTLGSGDQLRGPVVTHQVYRRYLKGAPEVNAQRPSVRVSKPCRPGVGHAQPPADQPQARRPCRADRRWRKHCWLTCGRGHRTRPCPLRC
jgi:hypothetical protein